jgi:hypothetical protein
MTRPTSEEIQQRPIRAGVFSTLRAAHAAVDHLLATGFSRNQVTVICSDETKERQFREFEHQQPAGANTPAAAAAGSAAGAAVGGLAAGAAAVGAAGVAAGGLPLVAVAAGLLTGGMLGGFLGAMMTRGVEKEAANFYDQAVIAGKLLVTVEAHGDNAAAELARAERILAEAGAEPLPLPEG